MIGLAGCCFDRHCCGSRDVSTHGQDVRHWDVRDKECLIPHRGFTLCRGRMELRTKYQRDGIVKDVSSHPSQVHKPTPHMSREKQLSRCPLYFEPIYQSFQNTVDGTEVAHPSFSGNDPPPFLLEELRRFSPTDNRQLSSVSRLYPEAASR